MTLKENEDYAKHMKWIEECESCDNLTEWEEAFVASIKKQLEKKGKLSRDQVEKLEHIYSEKRD